MAFADLVLAVDRAVLSTLGGTDVTYQPLIGEAVVVAGLFDEETVILDLVSEAGAQQLGPAVFLRIADLPIHPDADEPTLTIGGTTYHVRQRQSDGMGGIRLFLHRVTS